MEGRPMARTTGFLYLLYFVTAIASEVFMRGMIVAGEPPATAANITAYPQLFALSFAVGLIATALHVAVTILFYRLFKPVNKTVALFALFVSLAGCIIQAIGSLYRVVPDGSTYLSAFNLDQMHIYLVFFGMFNISIGYLILKSDFLPRILGVLMVLSGSGWLTFLSPGLAKQLFAYISALGILSEVSLMLWLLIKGVNIERGTKQSSAAVG
jgi:TRAP-type C4-dicarboxylate transport system permease small subunit